MRVAVLGAASPTGRRAARALVEHPEISSVVISDDDPDFCRGFAEGLGRKASAHPAEPRGDFAGALDECDLAVACLDAPRESAALRAAIRARRSCLSTSSDMEEIAAALELNDMARRAGVLLVVGLAWSPGITNLLAAHAASTLDEVRVVRVAWRLAAGGGMQSAWTDAARALAGNAVVYEEGAWRREPAGSGFEEQVFFPEPVGWRSVRRARGAEPLTLPSAIKGLEQVSVKGSLAEPLADRLVRSAGRRREIGTAPERIAGILRRVPALLRGPGGAWSALRVDVIGRSGGRAEARAYGVLDQLANLTSAPAVAAVVMAARGEVTGAGVHPPEGALGPRSFLGLLAEKGVRAARLGHEPAGDARERPER